MTQLPFWLCATFLSKINVRSILDGYAQFNSIEKLFKANDDELRSAGFSPQSISQFHNPPWQKVERELAWVQAPGRWIIGYDNPDYPQRLKEISDPPLAIYGRGNRSILTNAQMAMVGSRHASDYGIKNAKFFAAGLANAGLTITSGLAIGIDGACHEGALSVNGQTIAVCGTGLNYVYPTSHKRLAEKILDQHGALISEFPVDTQPFPSNFPRRNRIIAGLSLGVIVVEAAVKSGSLITARHAFEHDREVFAIPANIHHPLARGGHHLIRQGAKLVEKIEDITEEFTHLSLPVSTIARAKSENALAPIAPECQKLLLYIEYETTPMDVIVLRSGFTATQVFSMLLTLELKGYVEAVPGGYARVTNR